MKRFPMSLLTVEQFGYDVNREEQPNMLTYVIPHTANNDSRDAC